MKKRQQFILKKLSIVKTLAFCFALIVLSCNSEKEEVVIENFIQFQDDLERVGAEVIITSGKPISDFQDNVYQTTQINDQLWTTSNHLQTIFNNGDPIPQAKKRADWEKAVKNKQPIWCYYDFDEANKDLYGVYYNWYAVNDPRGICPKGWQVTPDSQIDLLSNLLDYDAHPLKESGYWKDNSFDFNQTKFSARPGGYVFRDGSFFKGGELAMFWISNQKDEDHAYYFDLTDSFNMIGFSDLTKGFGLNIRLCRVTK